MALLNEKGLQPEVIEYLNEVPSEEELSALLKQLGMKAEDLIRKGEAIFKEEFKGKALSEAEWIKAMVTHPKLIERPIVVNGQKAVVARPAELIEGII